VRSLDHPLPALASALVALAAFLGLQVQAGAQPGVEVPSASPPLTLAEAIELALLQNPEVLAAAQAVRSARGRVAQARSFSPPSLSLEVEEVTGADPGKAGVTSLGLAQSFELGGKRGLRGGAATLEAEALAVEEERVRRQVSARVREQYYLATFLERNTRDLARSVELLEEFAITARARFAAAAVPYLDVVRAQIELSRARNDLVEVRRDLAAATAELNLLLGRSGKTPFSLATPLIHEALGITEEDAVKKAAEGARLARTRLRLQAAEASRRLAGRARIPDVEIAAAAQRLREGEETTAAWGAGLALNLPMPWWKAPSGLVQEAEADRDRLRVELAAEEREVESAARVAFETARAAEAQVNAFETSILDDAESELGAGIRGYETGAVDALNLIDIYRTYVTSRTEYGRSLYLYLSALARLEVAGDLEL